MWEAAEADEADEAEKRGRAGATSAGETCGKARHPLTTRTPVHSYTRTLSRFFPRRYPCGSIEVVDTAGRFVEQLYPAPAQIDW